MKKQFVNIILLNFALFFYVACGGSSSSSNPTTNPNNNSENTYEIIATGGSFSNPQGLIYGINTTNSAKANLYKDAHKNSISSYQDSIVRSYQQKVYILNRDSNSSVLVLENSIENKNPIANYSLAEKDPNGELDVDGGFNGTNPYDLAFVSESIAYVALYNSNSILKINPLTGKRLSKIDVSFIKALPNATPSDANMPCISKLELVGTNLYILAQRFDANYAPLEPAIVIFNTQTNEFLDINPNTPEIDGIILHGKNPYDMVYASNEKKIFVAQHGNATYTENYSAIASTEEGSAGIEAIDLITNKSLGIIISGTAFGGTTGGYGVSKILYDSKNNKVFASYDTFNFTSNFKEINLSDKTVKQENLLAEDLPSFGGAVINDNSRLFTINRNATNPSIDIYGTNTGILLHSLKTELPMQSISLTK